jgi:hypothetical protein
LQMRERLICCCIMRFEPQVKSWLYVRIYVRMHVRPVKVCLCLSARYDAPPVASACSVKCHRSQRRQTSELFYKTHSKLRSLCLIRQSSTIYTRQYRIEAHDNISRPRAYYPLTYAPTPPDGCTIMADATTPLRRDAMVRMRISERHDPDRSQRHGWTSSSGRHDLCRNPMSQIFDQ